MVALIIAATGFWFWFLIIAGPGSSIVPGQGQ